MNSESKGSNLSTPRILSRTLEMMRRLGCGPEGDYLDIGAGHGDLIRLVQKQWPGARIRACDYTDELMRVPGIKVDLVNLNTEGLPYKGNSFDVVASTEVVEHLENHRFAIREMFRVLKPGGVLVLSTPNVINLRSRMRYFVFGFPGLFGPLHFGERQLYSPAGHINPVSHFFLVHALVDAGFSDIETSVDKHQRTSWAWLVLLWVPIMLGGRAAERRERVRLGMVDERNERFVRQVNSIDLLVGRTIIIGCRKPSV